MVSLFIELLTLVAAAPAEETYVDCVNVETIKSPVSHLSRQEELIGTTVTAYTLGLQVVGGMIGWCFL